MSCAIAKYCQERNESADSAGGRLRALGESRFDVVRVALGDDFQFAIPIQIYPQSGLGWYYYPNYGASDGLFGDPYILSPIPGTSNIFAVDTNGRGVPALLLRNAVSTTNTPGLWYIATRVTASCETDSKNIALIAGESFPPPPFNICLPPNIWNCGFADVFLDLKGGGLSDAISYNKYLGGNPWIARNTGNGFLDRVEIHTAAAGSCVPSK